VIALRFENDSLSGGAVEFDADEVESLVWRNTLSEQLYHLESLVFNSVRSDSGKKTMTVTFRKRAGDYDTIGKLESLFDLKILSGHPAPMLCRYEYWIDQDISFICQMKRDDMRWDYAAGRQDADRLLVINFEGTIYGDNKGFERYTLGR